LVLSGTFSLVVLSKESNKIGVAVASGSKAVGDRVPHVMPGIGAVATQAYTQVTYGVKGLELMKKGIKPRDALNTLLEKDPESNRRQVAMIDIFGRKATFTGNDAPEWNGKIEGENYIAIGNLLSGDEVIREMAKAFKETEGNLVTRMAKALKMASMMGGDRRGENSAALLLAGPEKMEANIKVDYDENPIECLIEKLT